MKEINQTVFVSLTFCAVLFCSLTSLLDPAQAVSPASLTVGVSAPLSGDLAEYGAAVRNGILLAQDTHSADFQSIKFVFEDNQYEPAKAVSAFRKLRDLDGADLVYNWGEPTLNAIAPIAERDGFPVIAMSLDPNPSLGKHFIVRSINHSDQYARILMEYLRAKGYKKIAILKTEDPFLNSMVEGLRRHQIPGEEVVVYATFNPGAEDFRTQIARVKNETFDVLGVYLFSGQVSAFYRQAAALNLSLPTFGTDFFESRTEIQQAKGHMQGAVYPNLSVPAEFVESYRARFDNDSQIAYAYNAFEFAKLTARLFRNVSKRLSGEEIIQLYTDLPAGAVPFQFRDTPDGGKFYEFPLIINKVEGEYVKAAR